MNQHIPHHKVVRVAHASIISESKYLLRFFFCYVHPITQQYEVVGCSLSSETGCCFFVLEIILARVVSLLLLNLLFIQYVNIVTLFLWEPQPLIYISWILFRSWLRSCVVLPFHPWHLVVMLAPLACCANYKICCVGILFRVLPSPYICTVALFLLSRSR